MSCTEWEREIAGEPESEELAAHLKVCANCRAFAREIEANRTALRDLPVDAGAMAAVRLQVLHRIEAGRRRRWMAWPLVAAACAAGLFAPLAVTRLRNPAPPAPVEFAKIPPRIEWTVKSVATPRKRHNFGPVVANAAPAQNNDPLVVKMLTNDPNVIIIWLVDKKGDAL